MEVKQAIAILEETKKNLISFLAKTEKFAPAKAKKSLDNQIDALSIAIEVLKEK